MSFIFTCVPNSKHNKYTTLLLIICIRTRHYLPTDLHLILITRFFFFFFFVFIYSLCINLYSYPLFNFIPPTLYTPWHFTAYAHSFSVFTLQYFRILSHLGVFFLFYYIFGPKKKKKNTEWKVGDSNLLRYCTNCETYPDPLLTIKHLVTTKLGPF